MGRGLPGLWLRDGKGWEARSGSLGRKVKMGTVVVTEDCRVFMRLGTVCAEAWNEGELLDHRGSWGRGERRNMGIHCDN